VEPNIVSGKYIFLHAYLLHGRGYMNVKQEKSISSAHHYSETVLVNQVE
jgi:hypothetical protein